MLAHFRLITSGRPRVRRTVVVDSLVEHLTVDFGHNYSPMAFSISYHFVLGTSRSQGGFSGKKKKNNKSQLNFLGSDRRVQ